jgi:hypothetical protein
MRLRESSEDVEFDENQLDDESDSAKIPHGTELREFATAVLKGDSREVEAARKKLINRVGIEGMLDAAGVIGFFNAINCVADATGTTMDEKYSSSTHYLDFGNRFQSKKDQPFSEKG